MRSTAMSNSINIVMKLSGRPAFRGLDTYMNSRPAETGRERPIVGSRLPVVSERTAWEAASTARTCTTGPTGPAVLRPTNQIVYEFLYTYCIYISSRSVPERVRQRGGVPNDATGGGIERAFRRSVSPWAFWGIVHGRAPSVVGVVSVTPVYTSRLRHVGIEHRPGRHGG